MNYSDTEAPEVDHQELARAVICRAIEDVTSPDSSVTDAEIREAALFLTSNRRQYYEARELWCLVAGLEYDPQTLRAKVIKAIESGDKFKLANFNGQ